MKWQQWLFRSNTDIREQVAKMQPMIEKQHEVPILLAYTKDQIQELLDKNSRFFHLILQKKENLLHEGLESSNWNFHKKNGVRKDKNCIKLK